MTSAQELEQLVRTAEELIQQEKWSQAIKVCRKVIRKYEDSAPGRVWLWLARCYLNDNKRAEAVKTAEEGLVRHPEQVKLLVLAGKIASSENRWEAAAAFWARVIEDPELSTSLVYWANLAKAQRLSGQLEKAESTARQGSQEHEGSTEILVELAEALTEKKQWKPALGIWVKAMTAITKMDSPSVPTKQHIRLNISILQRLVNIEDYKKEIDAYRSSGKTKKIAVVTSMTQGYDALKPPEKPDDRIDYIVYTNDKVEDFGIFDVRPLPLPDLDDARAIRYIKTHPHTVLGEYEIVVWADTSLMVVGDLYPLIKKFKDSEKAVGSGVHPLRRNIYEEYEANVQLNKENQRIMKKQINFYKKQGFTHDDLSENTLLMFNNNNPLLAPAMETWWDQICRFSRRDQLSFNYSLALNGVDWFRLTSPPQDIRNHPNFVITAHHFHPPILEELADALKR